MLPRVGLGFFFFSVYARYFSTICNIEGQGLFVSSEAQPAPKAAAAHPFCQLDLGIKVRLRVTRGNTCICFRTTSDLGPAQSAAHIIPMDLKRYPKFISQAGKRCNRNTKRNVTVFRVIFRVFPQHIKKPLTNCRRFIRHNLHCGLCLIHRSWKLQFFRRNNLQPPDF